MLDEASRCFELKKKKLQLLRNRSGFFTFPLSWLLQAIARKLQEKEMKEERRRQKHLDTNFEEEYFEDQGG